jgi:hypothetical protein
VHLEERSAKKTALKSSAKKTQKSPPPASKPVSKLKGKFWWIQFHDKQTYIAVDGSPCEGRFDMEVGNKSGTMYGLYEGRAIYLSRGVKDTVQASLTIVCPEVKIDVQPVKFQGTYSLVEMK